MKDWETGNIVTDQAGNAQIVLFVDNDGTFKCMNFKGDINTYSCSCHKFRSNSIKDYLSKPINDTLDYINGTAKTFSSRTKQAIISQLEELLQ